jgi:hypothetical protein
MDRYKYYRDHPRINGRDYSVFYQWKYIYNASVRLFFNGKEWFTEYMMVGKTFVNKPYLISTASKNTSTYMHNNKFVSTKRRMKMAEPVFCSSCNLVIDEYYIKHKGHYYIPKEGYYCDMCMDDRKEKERKTTKTPEGAFAETKN